MLFLFYFCSNANASAHPRDDPCSPVACILHLPIVSSSLSLSIRSSRAESMSRVWETLAFGRGVLGNSRVRSKKQEAYQGRRFYLRSSLARNGYASVGWPKKTYKANIA
jgi:hypothetical protein